MWSPHPEGGDQGWSSRRYDRPAQRADDGVTLAVVGIRRTASNWARPSDYDDHFSATSSFTASPTAQRRGRVGSEPTTTFTRFPGHYSKTETASSNTSITPPFAGSRFLNGTERRDPLSANGHFAHDQQRGIGECSPPKSHHGREMDVDDALDEVFASIVRRALSDDAVSPSQTQTSPAASPTEPSDNSERLRNLSRPCYNGAYESTSARSKRLHSRHPDHLTQPFFVKRTVSSSAVVDSHPSPYQRREEQQHAYRQASVENREKPFSQQLEKVSTGVGAKNSATAQVDDDQGDSSAAWSYQPYYYRSATAAPATTTECGAEIENRPQRQAGCATIKLPDFDRIFREKETFVKPNPNLQKSEPFLNRKQESLEKLESFLDKADEPDRSESASDKKRNASAEDERLASGVTSYYGGDITTSSTSNGNQRRLPNEPGGGKLRTAKSESSLRMANKELLLSDKEIYQVSCFSYI